MKTLIVVLAFVLMACGPSCQEQGGQRMSETTWEYHYGPNYLNGMEFEYHYGPVTKSWCEF